MPKSKTSGDGPKRRAKAVALEPERGLVMRVLLHSPKDTLAAAVAFTGAMTILINAMFLQAGRHPSPMFGTTIALPKYTAHPPAASNQPSEAVAAMQSPTINPVPGIVSPLPRPRPLEADMRSGDPIGNLVRSTSVVTTAPASIQRTNASAQSAPATTQSTPDPLAQLIGSSQRIAAVQRALTDYGYGQIKPTGTVGPDTQLAIQKFERQYGQPITGNMSEKLIRDLTTVTGRSFN